MNSFNRAIVFPNIAAKYFSFVAAYFLILDKKLD